MFRTLIDFKSQDELGFDREFKDKLKSKGISISEILDTADLATFVRSRKYSIQEAIDRFSPYSKLEDAFPRGERLCRS